MSDKQNTPYQESIINPRQQIIEDLNNMLLPSDLTIRLYARALRKHHDDQIHRLKDKEALLQKNITEVFAELLAHSGRPVKIKAENQTNYFEYLQLESKQFEEKVSTNNEEDRI